MLEPVSWRSLCKKCKEVDFIVYTTRPLSEKDFKENEWIKNLYRVDKVELKGSIYYATLVKITTGKIYEGYTTSPQIACWTHLPELDLTEDYL